MTGSRFDSGQGREDIMRLREGVVFLTSFLVVFVCDVLMK